MTRPGLFSKLKRYEINAVYQRYFCNKSKIHEETA